MSFLLASRRLRATVASLLLGAATSTFALDTATIVSSALSPDCLEYRIAGICYWLYCTPFGCSVRTSVKVRHYVPDAVVSSYSNTGENPWLEVRAMSMPNPTAKAGGDGTTNHDNENNLAKFKNADVIGHPAGMVFSQFASASGYTCEGAGTAFMPYLLSTLDTIAWRYNIPEAFYPEALIPGRREIGTRTGLNLWGNVYPRGGFLHQTDDHKSGAVVAQRAGDIVTRRNQIHVYQPLLANARDGYWPAGREAFIVGSSHEIDAAEEDLATAPAAGVRPPQGPGVVALLGLHAGAAVREDHASVRERGRQLLPLARRGVGLH